MDFTNHVFLNYFFIERLKWKIFCFVHSVFSQFNKSQQKTIKFKVQSNFFLISFTAVRKITHDLSLLTCFSALLLLFSKLANRTFFFLFSWRSSLHSPRLCPSAVIVYYFFLLFKLFVLTAWLASLLPPLSSCRMKSLFSVCFFSQIRDLLIFFISRGFKSRRSCTTNTLRINFTIFIFFYFLLFKGRKRAHENMYELRIVYVLWLWIVFFAAFAPKSSKLIEKLSHDLFHREMNNFL